MVEMLAAGSRVIVRPSEHTPASALLLREMVEKTFNLTLVHVAVGGIGVARACAGGGCHAPGASGAQAPKASH